jgi:hypothetical protein
MVCILTGAWLLQRHESLHPALAGSRSWVLLVDGSHPLSRTLAQRMAEADTTQLEESTSSEDADMDVVKLVSAATVVIMRVSEIAPLLQTAIYPGEVKEEEPPLVLGLLGPAAFHWQVLKSYVEVPPRARRRPHVFLPVPVELDTLPPVARLLAGLDPCYAGTFDVDRWPSLVG